MNSWVVWGDGFTPLLEHVSEDEAKQYVEDRPNSDLYLVDEDGNEYEYNQATGEWSEDF
jgi:hypothetical protein